MIHRILTAVVLVLTPLTGYCQYGPDYLVEPRAPKLAKDGHTSLFVDFGHDNPLVHSASKADLDLKEIVRTKDGGRGSLSFLKPGNFDPASFTIELICRLSEDVTRETKLLHWGPDRTVGFQWSFDSLRLLGSGAARKYPFSLSLPVGGDGMTIPKTAKGQWVYVAAGIDLKSKKSLVWVRDLSGNVLDKKMTFVRLGGFSNDPFAKLPDEQKAAATEQCWSDFIKSLETLAGKDTTSRFTLGHASMEIRQFRISKGYRDDVLTVKPAYTEPAVKYYFAPDIDAKRAVTHTVTRRLGYDGYNNVRLLPVEEKYIPLSAGSGKITMSFPKLPVGFYSLMLYGTIDPQGRKELERVWRPCPMDFTLRDEKGTITTTGKLLLKQSFTPRRMQGFHFHVDRPGTFTAEFSLGDKAQETARIQWIRLVDVLDGLPDVAVKNEQMLDRPEKEPGRLTMLDAKRKSRDEVIWQSMPPLNQHWQLHNQVVQFTKAPEGVRMPQWQTLGFAGQPGYRHHLFAYCPLDVINMETKEVFPHEKLAAGLAWPGEFSDDGTGVFFDKSKYPDLKHDIYLTPRAQLLGHRVLLFLGKLGAGDNKAADLAIKYHETGDAQHGHDAALALVRLAYDYPATEQTLHEIRLNTHAPDFEFANAFRNANGKYYGSGWSGPMVADLMVTYDRLFPYIEHNQVFADAVQRFIPWVKKPEDVVRLLDRYLVFAGVRDYHRHLARVAPIEDVAARILGPHPLTAKWFDLTQQEVLIYPYNGTYQELYATALSRSGCYHIGSFLTYALGDAQHNLRKARLIKDAKNLGIPLLMDLSDIDRHPRIKGASNFLFDMWVAGGYPFMVGDASGGPHANSAEAYQRLKSAKSAVRAAFDLTGDPRHAWFLVNRCGETDPVVVNAAKGQIDPIMNAPSRVVPDYGAILELGDPEQATTKTAATLRLGIARGHAHSDYLDLNLFGMGLPLAVDLACRNEGAQWSRPSAGWAFLHNHAIAHDSDNPAQAGGQQGEPWLRAFTPPLLRASYVETKDQSRLDRDVLMMQVGDSNTFYAFDVQRLRGKSTHTWCFHGCESQDLKLNVPMQPKTVRWIDRTLKDTHFVGPSADVLQATWTMTREPKEYPHEFMNKGVVKTLACEPHILGTRYDPSLPPVRVRATLLGQKDATVLQGNPYSQPYAYCFPFLWVQKDSSGKPSTYPAVYEWYRGDEPVIAKTELLQSEPLTVKVTTTSGQVDTFESTSKHLSAVSRDAKGIRWAKLSGGGVLKTDGLSIQPEQADFEAKIVNIDYRKRTLRVDRPLPTNPHVMAGNEGRRCYLKLKGEGTTFTWDDDLLVHESRITSLTVTGPDRIDLKTDHEIFAAGAGNRSADAFTVTTEDHAWHFRAGKVIHQPKGVKLTEEVFVDANADGRIHAKTYELGLGDSIATPVGVTFRRVDSKIEVQTNVKVRIQFGTRSVTLDASPAWQKMD